MLYGYSKIYDQLKSWNAGPIKLKVVWPDGKGGKNYPGWSPPGGYVRIARNWFWADDSGWVNLFKTTGYMNTKKWVVRELTHEALHQWFYSKVYTPTWTVHNTFGTHDFIEDPDITFFEECAEFSAIEINRLAFKIVNSDPDNEEPSDDHNNEVILSRRGVYLQFKNAKKRASSAEFVGSPKACAHISN